jgi:two-component sensor histidine kinase
MTFLRFKRGEVRKGDAGVLAKQLRIEIETLVGFGIKKHFLFEGLSEAITNVSQHAYPDLGGHPIKQWWLSASYEKEKRELSVMFYDQGAGIPVTLPSSHLYEFMKEVFNRWQDSEKIEAAMEVGRSSSELAERGKGLQNLLEFARSHREGRLSIYSLRGMYRIVSKRDGTDPVSTTEKREYQNSIGGTLIEWTVRL